MKKKFAFLLIAAILLTFASCGEVSSELPMSVDDSSRMNVSQNEISVPYDAELEDEAEDSAVRDISPEEVLEISSGMSAHNDVSYDNRNRLSRHRNINRKKLLRSNLKMYLKSFRKKLLQNDPKTCRWKYPNRYRMR